MQEKPFEIEQEFFIKTPENKESNFYKKLDYLTKLTCRQLDKMREKRFGPDLIEKTTYVKEFDEEFSQFEEPIPFSEFLAKAKKAQIIFGGDIHDLEKTTRKLVEIMEVIQGPDLIIGVECVEINKQKIINEYLEGKISDEKFLKESGLLEFIPHQAQNYLKIFQIAKKLKLKILALDSHLQKRGISMEKRLEKRDEIAAQRIIQVFNTTPNTRMYIIFGQAHLAKNHLPGRIRKKLPQVSQLIFTQDIESIYNQALKKFGQVPLVAAVAKIEENKFVILNTSPLEIQYERLKNQYLFFEKRREAIESTFKEFFPYLVNFLAKIFNLDFNTLCFYYEEKKCKITLEKLLKNIDIGYDDKELETTLSPEEQKKLKRKNFLGTIKKDTPYLVLKRRAEFKDFVAGTMEIILEALEKANLRKRNPNEDEILIYLATKITKPDLKPKTSLEQKGEEYWRTLINEERELKII